MELVVLSETEVYDVRYDVRYEFKNLQATHDFISSASLLNKCNYFNSYEERVEVMKFCNDVN